MIQSDKTYFVNMFYNVQLSLFCKLYFPKSNEKNLAVRYEEKYLQKMKSFEKPKFVSKKEASTGGNLSGNKLAFEVLQNSITHNFDCTKL